MNNKRDKRKKMRQIIKEDIHIGVEREKIYQIEIKRKGREAHGKEAGSQKEMN